jgi:hypothetical protein
MTISMSTTFAIDSGSAAQAEGLVVEDDSRPDPSFPIQAAAKCRSRARRPLLKNPNTPFPGRRSQASPAPASDSQTEARCREALRWITTLPEGSVRVRVDRGHVVLEGSVAHATEREVAADAVRQLEGVTEVENRLDVQ